MQRPVLYRLSPGSADEKFAGYRVVALGFQMCSRPLAGNSTYLSLGAPASLPARCPIPGKIAGRDASAPRRQSLCKCHSPRRGGLFHTPAWCIAFLLLLAVCGCSSFNRDWRRAASQTTDPNLPQGRWEGSWDSDVTKHHGNLRCLMIADSNSVYRARFRATYGGILHFSYTARFEMQPHFDGWEFNGEADLGKLAGGMYYYEGRANSTNLLSTYRSKYDHGRFDLQRR